MKTIVQLWLLVWKKLRGLGFQEIFHSTFEYKKCFWRNHSDEKPVKAGKLITNHDQASVLRLSSSILVGSIDVTDKYRGVGNIWFTKNYISNKVITDEKLSEYFRPSCTAFRAVGLKITSFHASSQRWAKNQMNHVTKMSVSFFETSVFCQCLFQA